VDDVQAITAADPPPSTDRVEPRNRRRRWWHRPAGVAVAVTVLLGSTGPAANASVHRPTRAQLAAVAAETVDGPVHGEFPVVQADGSVQTRRWQWGEVVAVDQPRAGEPAVLTVASVDGFAGAYRVGADQLAGIALGAEVTVVGLVEPA